MTRTRSGSLTATCFEFANCGRRCRGATSEQPGRLHNFCLKELIFLHRGQIQVSPIPFFPPGTSVTCREQSLGKLQSCRLDRKLIAAADLNHLLLSRCRLSCESSSLGSVVGLLQCFLGFGRPGRRLTLSSCPHESYVQP